MIFSCEGASGNQKGKTGTLVSGLRNENPGLPFFVTGLRILVSGLRNYVPETKILGSGFPILFFGFRKTISEAIFLVLEPISFRFFFIWAKVDGLQLSSDEDQF